MKIYCRKTGSYLEEPEYQGGTLRFLYETAPGRALLKLLVAPPVSNTRMLPRLLFFG